MLFWTDSGTAFSNAGDHVDFLVGYGIIMDTVGQDFAQLGLKRMQVLLLFNRALHFKSKCHHR